MPPIAQLKKNEVKPAAPIKPVVQNKQQVAPAVQPKKNEVAPKPQVAPVMQKTEVKPLI